MIRTDCPLCGAEITFRVSRYYPATWDSPAEGGDIEDVEPSCECSESPCVDSARYFAMVEERAREAMSNCDPHDDGDYAYECARDEGRL